MWWSLLLVTAAVMVAPRPAAAAVCNVGAPTGGNDAALIQAQIASCSGQGGGTVVLQSGATYTAGTIELESNVTLDLNDATLQTTDDIADYEGLKCQGCHEVFIGTKPQKINVSLLGPGTILKASDSDFEVTLVEFADSSNVTVQNVTLDSTGAPPTASGFHLVSIWSDNVLFDGVTVRGGRAGNQVWGNDGIDIQNSQDVTISNCDVDTHDDGIALATPEPNEMLEKRHHRKLHSIQRFGSTQARHRLGGGHEQHHVRQRHDRPVELRGPLLDL